MKRIHFVTHEDGVLFFLQRWNFDAFFGILASTNRTKGYAAKNYFGISLPHFLAADKTFMMEFVDKFLGYFETCFSRKAVFYWFVTIIIGFMLRSDKLGIPSVIHDFPLRPGCYIPMIHFFRASSWFLENVRIRWLCAVRTLASFYKEGNFHVHVGDGVKQAKKGRYMLGVKKLFQESENSSKSEYIYGHMFGGLGVLADSIRNWACIPLRIRLHDGIQAACDWKGGSAVSPSSHIVQMV